MDGSVGFYSRDRYDKQHEVSGISQLVIVEIKKVGVLIGADEKSQPWKYVRKLRDNGYLGADVKVFAFVLGSRIDPNETGLDQRSNGTVDIVALSYNTFIKRAEARMLGLKKKLLDAPFLKQQGISDAYIAPIEVNAPQFDLQ